MSAIEHRRFGDTTLAARIASTAIMASAGVDAERSKMYLDLLFKLASATRSEPSWTPCLHRF